MLHLLHFTSLTVNCSMSALSSTQLANSMQVLHYNNTDKGIIYLYCTHISPYPKITHFEKLLLNNTLKEYGFSPTFQCIHQLCLFPARKENWPGVGCFPFALFILPKKIILSIDQQNASSKFHSVFVPFILHLCIKLITNKLQPLPVKFLESSLFQCSMQLPLVMFAYLRFMERLHELTGFCPRPNLNQT